VSSHAPFFSRPPLAAWLVALAAAMLHLAPLWRAEATVAPEHGSTGHEFTGCLATSPDAMQYRAWARRTEHTGPICDNRFTTEPHRAYLPVFFHAAVGALARATDQPPEFVYEWLGAPFAFALALLLYACARRFLDDPRARWWVFLATLVGGGLGGHLKLLADRRMLGPETTQRLTQWLEAHPVWEAYRSHYAIKVLFDTHFLVAWSVAILALLAFHAAAQRASARRLVLAAAAACATTLLHAYEGPLLLLIYAATLALAHLRGVASGDLRRATLVAAVSTAATLGALAVVHVRSGLPLPGWRPPDVTLASLLLAYPLVLAIGAFGLVAYWRRASLDEVFLLGWSAGCLAMTLSGPLYPYADRGPTTAQVPLFLVAGGMYFAGRTRVPRVHALLALFVLGATPARELRHRWRVATFDPYRPAIFLSAERRKLVDTLVAAAGETSVLLAPPKDYRWLSPEFPGRSYDAHFFLTVDFERKRVEVDAFFASNDLAAMARFLDQRGIEFVYVPPEMKPERLAGLPGWRELARAHGGVLLCAQNPSR
jgi:hypothetical protein